LKEWSVLKLRRFRILLAKLVKDWPSSCIRNFFQRRLGPPLQAPHKVELKSDPQISRCLSAWPIVIAQPCSGTRLEIVRTLNRKSSGHDAAPKKRVVHGLQKALAMSSGLQEYGHSPWRHVVPVPPVGGRTR